MGAELYLTMENDALVKHDDDYTHGTELEFVNDRGVHFLASQTMYAPSDLKREDHIKGDRPYCGMLLGGLGYELYNRSSGWSNYGEANLGIIGPFAKCKETQTMIHRWLHCRKPMGWDNQLHNEFVVNAQWWTKYNWSLCDYVALVPRIGLAGGTIQDFTEVGCDLKIGWNIRRTVKNNIIFSSTRGDGHWNSRLSAYVYAGVCERYYLYNHILEGSMFGHKDDGLDVDIEPFVGEARVGAVLKYDKFFFTYYVIFRSYEFKGQHNSPNFGGIGLGWSW